jgi:hypothetical protein
VRSVHFQRRSRPNDEEHNQGLKRQAGTTTRIGFYYYFLLIDCCYILLL